jgi:hypothetical protein
MGRRQRLERYTQLVAGEDLTRNGTLGENEAGVQCVNVWNTWLWFIGFPSQWGNARDFVGQDLKYLHYVRKEEWNIPEAGDGVLFTGPTISPFGHVGVCLEAQTGLLVTLDADYPPGSWVHRQAHDYAEVAGWLHPRTWGQDGGLRQAAMEYLQARFRRARPPLVAPGGQDVNLTGDASSA